MIGRPITDTQGQFGLSEVFRGPAAVDLRSAGSALASWFLNGIGNQEMEDYVEFCVEDYMELMRNHAESVKEVPSVLDLSLGSPPAA